jgi:hypothetical protein
MLLGNEKAKIGPQSPKTEFVLQNLYGRVICLSIGSFIRSKKIYTLRGQKGENKPLEHTHEFWCPKSVWSCNTFIDRKKRHAFKGEMGEKKKARISLQSPKTGFGIQNLYCCVICLVIGNYIWFNCLQFFIRYQETKLFGGYSKIHMTTTRKNETKIWYFQSLASRFCSKKYRILNISKTIKKWVQSKIFFFVKIPIFEKNMFCVKNCSWFFF